MPEVSEKEIGRRLFHVHREKRVELAIKKMMAGIGAEWKTVTAGQVRVLSHILQCTWNAIDQKAWDTIPFDRMTKRDLDRILSLGEGVSPGKNPSPENIDEVKRILLTL